jgi:hypothetical protein
MYCKTAWNDYFTATSITHLNSQTYASRQIPSGSNVYVSNCLFNSFTSTSNGGALYCTSATCFLVESSSFFSCKTSSGSGGAIYFSNSGAQSVLYEVCCNDCRAASGSDYQFAFVLVNNAASSMNYFNYSSITRCVNENSAADFTLGLGNGKICCPSVNSSMNKLACVSGIYCYPLSDSNSVTCLLSHSTFADNIDTTWVCIYLWTGGAKFEIQSCNILRNTQVNFGSCGIIYTCGNVMVENSCILENNAPYIFYQASSYTFTVSNCTLDKTTFYGSYKTMNVVAKSFILALNHMSTRNCHAVYDNIGALTPITPLSSSNKQKLCYTYQGLFYQCQGSFVSLSSLLIIIFFYPGASCDIW